MNTTKKGDQFRDDVAQLLRIANYYNVGTEIRIGSKKVDIYFEEKSLGSTKRIGVECKNYDKPLTKSYISTHIYPDYDVLIKSNKLDQVLIVAKHDLNADAKTYINEAPCFSFMTFVELQNQLMDFTRYEMSIKAQYKEEGLDEYYVRPQFSDNEDLENHVLAWLSNESCRPIAILAGYGMGKTSFARHIAYVVATEDLSPKGISRIPILIKLGDISSEQGLEGLIGKVLAANSAVRNYHFDIFMELNRRGRFFIILDGFDEMKHTMSWNQFKYNFSELNRLVAGKSKVLLLGRPSAFLSGAEHYFAIRGIRNIRGKEMREPGSPDYEEIDLSPFTEERAHLFIEQYIRYAHKREENLQGKTAEADYLDERLNEIKSNNYTELISRPVQARMLTDIAIDRDVTLHAFTRYDLYDIFVTRIIEREHNKSARRVFSYELRRDFIRKIAWWLWVKSGLTGFHSKNIPNDIIDHYLREEMDREDVARDLLVGSILERKLGDNFFFPHRSFQEFLVAEFILETEWHDSELVIISKALNPEVINFIKDSKRHKKIMLMFDALKSTRGILTINFLGLIAWSLVESKYDIGKSAELGDIPWMIIVKVLTIFEKNKDDVLKATNYCVKSFSSVANSSSKVMCLICMFIVAKTAADMMQKLIIYQHLAALILKEALPSIEGAVNQPLVRGKRVVNAGKDNFFMDCVIEAFSGRTIDQNNDKQKDAHIKINLEVLYAYLQKSLANNFEIGEPREFPKIDKFELAISTLRQSDNIFGITKKGTIIEAFFRRYEDPKNLVKVENKRKVIYPNMPTWVDS